MPTSLQFVAASSIVFFFDRCFHNSPNCTILIGLLSYAHRTPQRTFCFFFFLTKTHLLFGNRLNRFWEAAGNQHIVLNHTVPIPILSPCTAADQTLMIIDLNYPPSCIYIAEGGRVPGNKPSKNSNQINCRPSISSA